MIAALLGANLSLHPGRWPAIDGVRLPLAARVSVGHAADEAPERLARVFNLCGDAHRLAARLALAGARAMPIGDDDALRARLRWSTVREHVQRMAFDWTRLLDRATQTRIDAGRWLASLAPWPGAAQWNALPDWLERTGFGEPPTVWLARLDEAASCLAGALHWLRDAPRTALTQLLTALEARLQPLDVGWRPLHPRGAETATMTDLARSIAQDESFCRFPRYPREAPDTGPWCRIGDGADAWRGGPFARMLARVADTARLASPEGGGWLRFGSLPTGDGEGLGWCEMARGLLLHWVRLRRGEVADYRVVAPTEWNFHPDGVLAEALTRLPADAAEADVRLLAAAFDPCVGFEVARAGRERAPCMK